MRQLALSLVVLLCLASPIGAQSRLYTNADLGKPLARTHTPTADEMQSVLAHQFALSPSYDGPKVYVWPYDPTWPFTYAQRLEPDPWRLPGGWPLYGPWLSYGYPFSSYPVWRPHPLGTYFGTRPYVHDPVWRSWDLPPDRPQTADLLTR